MSTTIATDPLAEQNPSWTQMSLVRRVGIGLFGGMPITILYSKPHELLFCPGCDFQQTMTQRVIGAVVALGVGSLFVFFERPRTAVRFGAALWIGLILGYTIGWLAAETAFAADRQTLLSEGVPVDFLDGGKSGVAAGQYLVDGLGHGAVYGIQVGVFFAILWCGRLGRNWKTLRSVVLGMLWMALGTYLLIDQMDSMSNRNRSSVLRNWDREQKRVHELSLEIPDAVRPR